MGMSKPTSNRVGIFKGFLLFFFCQNAQLQDVSDHYMWVILIHPLLEGWMPHSSDINVVTQERKSAKRGRRPFSGDVTTYSHTTKYTNDT